MMENFDSKIHLYGGNLDDSATLEKGSFLLPPYFLVVEEEWVIKLRHEN